MKNLISFIIIHLSLFLSATAIAHEDDFLQGWIHEAFHIGFIIMIALVAYKAWSWLKTKQKQKQTKQS